MRRMVCAACCIFSLTVPLLGQTRALRRTTANSPYQQPVVVTRPYQQTWYDALLRQFNPDNLDWGHWLEQRRQAFLEQTAANPYFKYGLVTTVLLILLTMALTKALIDKSRIKWLAEERHEDLLLHDAYSRQAAREAIRKYNAHMEKCNRVVEAELAGRRVVNGSVAAAEAQGDSAEALAHAADLKRERDALAGKLEQNTAMVGQLAVRLNGIGVNVRSVAVGNESAHGDPALADLVKQNNELREQLYRERERNKRLKGM